MYLTAAPRWLSVEKAFSREPGAGRLSPARPCEKCWHLGMYCAGVVTHVQHPTTLADCNKAFSTRYLMTIDLMEKLMRVCIFLS